MVLILAESAGMLLPIAISNIVLGILLVYAAILVRPADIKTTLLQNWVARALLFYFVLQLIGMTYTANWAAGIFVLEKKLSFLLMPVVLLPAMVKHHLDVRRIFRWIGFITMAGSAGMVLYAMVYLPQDPTALYFENVTPIHYVYYSLYFGCCSLILLDDLSATWKATLKGVTGLTVLYVWSLLVMVLVASKTGLMMFIAASFLVLYHHVPSRKAFLVAAVSVLLLGATFLSLNDTTRSRFLNLTENLSVLQRDHLVPGEHITDLNMRLLFWKISISHAVADGYWITGTGTGDCQDYINEVYNLPQYKFYGYINWDSHNQWVFAFLQLGIAGILALAWIFGKSIFVAFRQKSIPWLCFLVITGGFTLSESILESNKGIVFFVLMMVLFAATPASTQQVDSPQKNPA